MVSNREQFCFVVGSLLRLTQMSELTTVGHGVACVQVWDTDWNYLVRYLAGVRCQQLTRLSGMWHDLDFIHYQ